MKILLIDDEAFALKLLVHQLASLGFRDVTSVTGGAEALAQIAGGARFDVILSDLQMPGMDGVEFVRALTQTGYGGELVLVSGEDRRILQTVEQLARAHGLRVLGRLTKPVTPERLAAVLAHHTDAVAAQACAASRCYGPDELRQAIAAGELVCHCQPKVSLATGALTGVEILVRWQHPVDGLVFPDRFISVSEEHGLIDDLTRLVLRDALRQTRAWFDASLEMHVAVNVSMENLDTLDFPDFVVAAALEMDVSLSSMVLEVTESRLMMDMRVPLDILTRLRLKYVDLSIDDFGTGHSSLAQLRDLPFNELKIDRSFVHGACRDTHLAAMCEASLDMARKLGMRSVAEGVEDLDDWNFLRDHGCDIAQGYFIARPMPMAALADWLPGWEARRRELGLVKP
ncbi:MAG: EAL domain-containing response regulator [Rhodocyclaceae bacterium]|nr:EAL domain-containing response regulator [Rhodocyclaceae bacterium]MDZ4215408.1 EAL domain-containing response regulator [Rhodocyclaceae bacterium]